MASQSGSPHSSGLVEATDATPALKTNDELKCTLCLQPCEVMMPCEVIHLVTVRNFFAAMDVCRSRFDIDAAAKLPLRFCTRCRDNMIMMSETFDRYVQTKEQLEMMRNSLALTAITSVIATQTDASSSEDAEGPQKQVRKLINERWNPLLQNLACTDQSRVRDRDLFDMTLDSSTSGFFS